MNTVSRFLLLSELPAYQDVWIMIKEDQTVKDIEKRIQVAHNKYAGYYDKIALYFDGSSIQNICDKLVYFCRNNIKYRQEPKDRQTTTLPTGLLERGYGDCKHYALFCGGVLSALQRLTSRKIKWCYRFASYNFLKPTPHHVFVVVKDGIDEIWLDPVPGAEKQTPFSWRDRCVNNSKNMALLENVAGFGNWNDADSLGILTNPIENVDPLNFDGTHKYAGVFDPYLGLAAYADYENSSGTNFSTLAGQLNTLIAAGPEPGHTVTADFVKWIFDNKVRSWNFFYVDGVVPGFTAEDLLPANYPRLVLTDDGRLTFDKLVPLDDYRNAEIHLLTAWAQSLINQYDAHPYPLKPSALKEFSQGKEGGIDTLNLFSEQTGDSIFKQIGKALEKTINFVKAGVLKIVGSIPRNATLALIGINAFNLAGDLWNKIQAGKWDSMAKTWKTIGGNPDKFYNTIQDGKDKHAILGEIGDNSIGDPISVSALLASAAPIIAILLKYLDKNGKATEIAGAIKPLLEQQFPQLALEMGDSFDFLDTHTGQPIQWVVDDQDNENLGGGNHDLPGTNSITDIFKNPVVLGGAAMLGTMLVLKKRGRKTSLLIPIIIGAGVYYFVSKGSSVNAITQKRKALLDYNANHGNDLYFSQVLNKMTDTEIIDVYDFIFNYEVKNIDVPNGTPLQTRLIAIGDKYQIFT